MIINTGIDSNHNDLKNVDVKHYKSFVNNNDGKKGNNVKDENIHGTYITNIINAKDNDVVVIGIITDISIIVIKIFESNDESNTLIVSKKIDHGLKYNKKGNVVDISFRRELEKNKMEKN